MLSSTTRNTLARLTAAPTSLWARLWATRRRRAALASLVDDDTPELILHLLPLLLGDPALADDVAHTLARILRRRPIATWPALERLRDRLRHDPPTPWSTLTPRQVPELARLAAGWTALGLASMHPDGRVRLAAVQALALRRDPEALAFLLLRRNDWAAPVRAAACPAIDAWLRPELADAWVATLPLLPILAARGRSEHAPLLAAITALLRSRAARPALVHGARSSDPDLRLASLRLALGAGIVDDVAVDAMSSQDPRTRRVVADHIDHLHTAPHACELVARALAHPDLALRRSALASLADQPLAHQRCVYTRLLADPRAATRRLAREPLRRLVPGFSAPAWYLETIPHTRDPLTLTALLLGYGECEDATDPDPLAAHGEHPKLRVRIAARIASDRITQRTR